MATDSIKNTIYILAKQHPITPPELFASILGSHFVQTYDHIHAAQAHIVTHRWARMDVAGKPHPHSFIKDSEETRTVQADVTDGGEEDGGITIHTGIRGLTVLKSTNSQFWGFLRDEYTTLPETWDRVLSTDVAADWQWKRFRDLDEVRGQVDVFDDTWKTARDVTLRIFAEDNSASVQNIMYKMADEILAYQSLIETVEYSLPNKHYFEIGMFLFPPDLLLNEIANIFQTSAGTTDWKTQGKMPRSTLRRRTPMDSSSAPWDVRMQANPSCKI